MSRLEGLPVASFMVERWGNKCFRDEVTEELEDYEASISKSSDEAADGNLGDGTERWVYDRSTYPGLRFPVNPVWDLALCWDGICMVNERYFRSSLLWCSSNLQFRRTLTVVESVMGNMASQIWEQPIARGWMREAECAYSTPSSHIHMPLHR